MGNMGNTSNAARTSITPQSSRAVMSLVRSGLIPDNCSHFELILDAKDCIRAKCEFIVSEDQMEKIAAALKDNPDEVERILRSATVISYRVGHQEFERIPNLEF